MRRLGETLARKRTRLVAAIAVLLLAAPLLAACGEDEKATYAQEVEDVFTPLGERFETLSLGLGSAKNEKELAAALADYEAALKEAASEIETLDVPEGVEDVNSDLVAALNGFAGEFANFREVAETGNTAELREAALALPDALSDFEAEQEEIQQAAIDAGVPIEEPEGEEG